MKAGRTYVLRNGAIVALLVLAIVGCEEVPTQPTVGSGNELKATIDGEAITFDIESSQSEYDALILSGRFQGTTSSEPLQSIVLTFSQFDIDNGTFPTTLSGADITMTVALSDAGDNKVYQCAVGSTDCSITLTGSNGEIVDGTFQGILTNTSDTNDKLTITNGQFSVKLTRV